MNVVGVYPVEASEPCHLIELFVRGNRSHFDVGAITQRQANRAKEDWQVPYAEKVLDPAGESVKWDLWHGPGDPGLWEGDVRLVFFLHYVDFSLPLSTPFGDVPLPSPSPWPTRLGGINYESP